MEWAWFFDVDGTLVEIAASPSRIVVHDELLPLIEQLHSRTKGAVSLITGRAIRDLDQFLPLPGISIAGQHGLELRTADGKMISNMVGQEVLIPVRDALTAAVARHPGLMAEFKGMSMALHYRRAPTLAGYAHRLVRSLQATYAPEFLILKGKRVVELRPAGMDKGEAIRRLMATEPFRGRTPVFIGDDVTDEAGFAVVNAMSGHSIKVGPGPSSARFRLRSVTQVREWLGAAMNGAAAIAGPEKKGER